ncbi:MAG: ImmA/IrrE family metallo-endopeptidase [Planctomycetes bacterium]|nr:ImmA/IrrE family metallo-endopeptidase [Planctomycetota bacterium]
MASSSLPSNLRRLRRAKALSQVELAELAKLSRAGLRKIEVGQVSPRAATLHSIARALDVPIQELLAPATEPSQVRFRSRKRLKSRDQILLRVGRVLADFRELEELLQESRPFRLESLAGELRTSSLLPEAAASRCRELMRLSPSEPVRDLCGLLEANGIKVLCLPAASREFFGLSVGPADGGPAVAVNTWERISVERWIFTAAHELGHLLLHLGAYDVAVREESDDEERAADAFAAEFLMPDAVFQREWAEARGLGLVDRVLKVKRIFHVSYRTVLHRLARADRSIWAKFQHAFARARGRTLLREDEPEALASESFRASPSEASRAAEPERLSPVDFTEDRLAHLVRRALEQEAISLGRAAEILSLSLVEMRALASTWVA